MPMLYTVQGMAQPPWHWQKAFLYSNQKLKLRPLNGARPGAGGMARKAYFTLNHTIT